MLKTFSRAAAGAVLATGLLGSMAIAWAQVTMNILISGRHMVSGTAVVIEVMDRTCGNQILGRWTVQANQNVAISVCRDGAGYANIATRNVTDNSDWHGASQLHEGETVYP